MYKKWIYAICTLGFLSNAMVSARAVIVDQNTLFPDDATLFSTSSWPLGMRGFNVGQVFTPGITGYLDSIDVQFLFGPSGPNDVDRTFLISRVGADGLPTGEVLATASASQPVVEDPSVFALYTLNIDYSFADVFLTAGEQYALIPTLSDPDVIESWGGWLFAVSTSDGQVFGNHYADGYGIYQFPGEAWQNFDFDPTLTFDVGFATYMRPVPLPAAIWLLLGALAVLPKRKSAT
ncbi:MAG: VPLPA-CTERM sorting domain-containing protein [Pseudomonadota bacterium]